MQILKKYKILYVDEVDSERRRFKTYIYNNDINQEFTTIAPEIDFELEVFLEKILSENYDAIISDHKLNEENSNIQFDGIDLIEAILKRRIDFPCFILTSYDDEAVRDGDDVNIVYIKGLMESDEEREGHKAKFIDKIENQIKHHRKKIENARTELLRLISLVDLNASEEARLIELDTYLEKTTHTQSSIPLHLKSTHNLDELHKMINNTDKLLAEFKSK
jgi:hypothetical protein